jgi:hypothetical protein
MHIQRLELRISRDLGSIALDSSPHFSMYGGAGLMFVMPPFFCHQPNRFAHTK